MKTALFILATLPVISMQAEEKVDSMKLELHEIVVEAQNQRVSPEVATFIPEMKQKEASQDALSLLARMGIPQLSVNQISGSVTTASGEDVSIFIDYIPATSDDLTGMRMKDVRKIEVLDFPSDPRFNGAEHVINFVMQKYEYGGYAKIHNQLFAGKKNFVERPRINSKFSYKKMTFDLVLGGDYSNNDRLGESEYSIFRFPSTETTPGQTIERDMTSNYNDKLNYHTLYATFRAVYNSQNIQIANTVGFNYWRQPHFDDSGILSFIPEDIAAPTSIEEPLNRKTTSLEWNGSYYFALPNDFSISLTPVVRYSNNYKNSQYIVNDVTLIHNIADDNALYANTILKGTKKLNDKINLTFGTTGAALNNEVEYQGSTIGDVELSYSALAPEIGMTYRLPKFYMSIDGGYIWEWQKTNGETSTFKYPFVHLSTNYSFSSKLSWNTWWQFASSASGASGRSPIMQQQNEYLWIQGNSELSNANHFTFNSSVTWLPSNKFQITPWVRYLHFDDIIRYIYTPGIVNGQQAIIKRLSNDGNYDRLIGGLNFTAKLLQNKLQLQANPQISYYSLSGTAGTSKTYASVYLGANYYTGDFNFRIGYSPKSKSLSSSSCEIGETSSSYWISAGWTKGDFSVEAYGINIFTNDLISYRSYLDTPYYSHYSSLSNGNNVPLLWLNVTYTIGFGKKIDRNDEIGQISGAGSGILE